MSPMAPSMFADKKERRKKPRRISDQRDKMRLWFMDIHEIVILLRHNTVCVISLKKQDLRPLIV